MNIKELLNELEFCMKKINGYSLDKNQIKLLLDYINNLMIIEQEHKELNGKLREDNKKLNSLFDEIERIILDHFIIGSTIHNSSLNDILIKIKKLRTEKINEVSDTEELHVGDYVRTKDDGIQQITKVTENGCFYRTSSCEIDYHTSIYDDDIIGKPSTKKIDLVRVGDFVNREEVLEVLIDRDSLRDMSRIKTELSTYFEDDIKSVVTDEQFKSEEFVFDK